MTAKQIHLPRVPRVILTLTPEIIRESVEGDSSHCMFAEAVRAAVPGARSVSVDLQTIRFTDPKKPLRYTYLTPRLAQIALVQFDQGIHPEAFSIKLRGGQVTKAAVKTSSRPHDGTSEIPDGPPILRANHGNDTVPDVVGGRTPPIGPLANVHYGGVRRAFGLRGLDGATTSPPSSGQ